MLPRFQTLALIVTTLSYFFFLSTLVGAETSGPHLYHHNLDLNHPSHHHVTTNKPLRFRSSDSTFKIVQIADVHFGEGEDTLWGPEQDVNSTRVMNLILSIEKPDFVMLTGDQITGNNVINNATAYWAQVIAPIVENGYPWASIFGNHDDLASGTGGTREDLMRFEIDSYARTGLCYSQFGPKHITGVSNYFIPVFPPSQHRYDGDGDGDDHINEEAPALLMYALDSGDSLCGNVSGNGCVMPDQVQWFSELAEGLREKYGNREIHSIAFVHIPLQEYMYLWNENITYGTNNDSVACQQQNTGVFAAFQKAGVSSVFCGHNHGNDFCGHYKGIRLCYGRHSGYGGYGSWERGARVIEFTLDNSGSGSASGPVVTMMKTWIRFEDGRRDDQTEQLHQPSPPYQTVCS